MGLDFHTVREGIFFRAERFGFNNRAFQKSLRRMPPDLLDLLEPTPLGAAKLLAAWDGLSLESQMVILRSGADLVQITPAIIEKAIRSVNPYIRYLAEKINVDGESASANDPVPLVRYCHPPRLESAWNDLGSRLTGDSPDQVAEEFYALPHGARLAIVSEAGREESLHFARLTSFGIERLLPSGRICEGEIIDLLLQFGWTDSFLDPELYHSIDGADIAPLWELARSAPEMIGRALTATLPPVPEESIRRLPRERLAEVLRRADVFLPKFRQSIFLGTYQPETQEAGETDNRLAKDATRYNLRLSYDGFAQILSLSEERRAAALTMLACSRNGLHLAILAATDDLLSVSIDTYEIAELVRDGIERTLKSRAPIGSGRSRSWEMQELRLYELAKRYAPWDGNGSDRTPSRHLAFLSACVVATDTWTTFRNFSKTWSERLFRLRTNEGVRGARDARDLSRHLRRIAGPDFDLAAPIFAAARSNGLTTRRLDRIERHQDKMDSYQRQATASIADRFDIISNQLTDLREQWRRNGELSLRRIEFAQARTYAWTTTLGALVLLAVMLYNFASHHLVWGCAFAAWFAFVLKTMIIGGRGTRGCWAVTAAAREKITHSALEAAAQPPLHHRPVGD